MSAPARSPQTYQTVFDELRNKNIFCDAVLKVEDKEFPVHKVILCRSSSYFRAMFERWGTRNDREFTLCGVSPKILSLVLEWIYTKSIRLSRKTIQKVLLAADMLLLGKLVTICFQHLEDNICPENCIGIWKFSNAVVGMKTRDLALRFILSRFEEVMECDEFLELTVQELSGFIEDDKLIVNNEIVVYKAILHWTNYNLHQRRDYFPCLLTKVRLALLSFEFVNNNVSNNALVQNNPNCMSTVQNSLQTIFEIAIDPDSQNRLARPRLPAAILLAIGGWSGSSPTNGIEAYDYKANCWINVTNSQEDPRAYHGSVFLNGSVYCVGGFDRREYFNSVRRLDLGTRTWHEMPPMYHRRCYVSVAVLNSCIYAIGGYNGHIRLNTAEVYDPETNQWSLIASMNEQRSDAKCATLNGKIYICGGFNGTECLQTAECYSAETNQWTMIAPLTIRRSGVAVIACANHIYAVGGFDGTVRLCSVEAYNPRTDSWREVASMLTTRSNFGIEVLNNCIFVVGGYNGFTTTHSVEYYDHLLDTWTEVCDMDICRSALDCCVISGLPNMADYTISRDALPLLGIEVFDEESP